MFGCIIRYISKGVYIHMSKQYIVINLEQDDIQLNFLTNLLDTQPISVYQSIDAYLEERSKEKVEGIKNWQELFYDEYLDKTETLLVITDMCKKVWKSLLAKVHDNSFYPVEMIRILHEDSEQKILTKIQSKKCDNKRKFFKIYHRLVEEDSSIDSNATFMQKVKRCPFCHSSSLVVASEFCPDDMFDSETQEMMKYIACDDCGEHYNGAVFLFYNNPNGSEEGCQNLPSLKT